MRSVQHGTDGVKHLQHVVSRAWGQWEVWMWMFVWLWVRSRESIYWPISVKAGEGQCCDDGLVLCDPQQERDLNWWRSCGLFVMVMLFFRATYSSNLSLSAISILHCIAKPFTALAFNFSLFLLFNLCCYIQTSNFNVFFKSEMHLMDPHKIVSCEY